MSCLIRDLSLSPDWQKIFFFLYILLQTAIAGILGTAMKNTPSTPLSHSLGVLVVVLVCVYTSSFAWSWGPLGWLIPSEIFPLDVRSAGQSIAISVNLFFTFLIAQVFLSLLCTFKWGIFLFFAAWVMVMQAFVLLFIPETKAVPIEEMELVWTRHWFWKRYFKMQPMQNHINCCNNNNNTDLPSADQLIKLDSNLTSLTAAADSNSLQSTQNNITANSATLVQMGWTLDHTTISTQLVALIIKLLLPSLYGMKCFASHWRRRRRRTFRIIVYIFWSGTACTACFAASALSSKGSVSLWLHKLKTQQWDDKGRPNDGSKTG